MHCINVCAVTKFNRMQYPAPRKKTSQNWILGEAQSGTYENLVILGEAQSMYFNFLERTRGGPVGIL